MAVIELFPSIENVFVDDYEQNGKHFMPIATIDLSLIDGSLRGLIHLVYYNNDPYCEENGDFFNEFCDDNKASFDIIGSKYKFKAGYGYFKTNNDWTEWLEMGKKSYEENKKLFKQEGNPDKWEKIKNIGRHPEWIQDDEWPSNKQGEKLTFICQVFSADFVKDYCGKSIFLFYDKTNKIAVHVCQVD